MSEREVTEGGIRCIAWERVRGREGLMMMAVDDMFVVAVAVVAVVVIMIVVVVVVVVMMMMISWQRLCLPCSHAYR
jgi:hypothetical protein